MAESSSSSPPLNNPKVEDSEQNDRNAKPPKDPKSSNIKAKTCKGCLYYSQSNANPRCLGLTGSLPPGHEVKEIHVQSFNVYGDDEEANKKHWRDYKYVCLGHSLYTAHHNSTKLPVCTGIEIERGRQVNNIADSPSDPSHIYNKEDGNGFPEPTYSELDNFFSRFIRSANLVASGVAKNVHRVGNQIKQGVDDIRRPK